MTWRDPITGDELGLSDWLSWTAQGLIRRWPFVFFHIALSLFWWTHPELFGDTADLPRWMAVYSLLAVVQESIVGIGVFSQTRRDAVVLRQIRSVLERQAQELAELVDDVEHHA